MDQGAPFMLHQFKEFASSLGIKLLNSSPYYTQANGQAEASNKTLIKLIKRKIEEKPRRWHEVLCEALWAYRVSQHGAIKVTPFKLVYGQEVVLPVEINLQSSRVAYQDTLSADEYKSSMMDEVDAVVDSRLKALEEIEKEKLKVNDLVWKTVLPLGTRDRRFGKWSPSWEGPFRVTRIVPRNSYFIKTLEGESLPKALNDKYLKRFCPSI
jgi:transposase InsO family protein